MVKNLFLRESESEFGEKESSVSTALALVACVAGGISCGHTTDFHLGKIDLPTANSLKISRGKFISGFVLPR